MNLAVQQIVATLWLLWALTSSAHVSSRVWTYDALYRLTNEVVSGTSPTGSNRYRYDAVGNRTNRTTTFAGVAALTNQVFSYSANDLLANDTYDSNGNTRTNAANTYAYDAENRLTNYNSGAATYIYNGDGWLVRKTIGATTTLYLVDDRNPTGYAQTIEEATVTSGVTNLAVIYLPGLDLVSQNRSGTVSYYGYDGNGNTRYLTGSGATVTDTYLYDAFGVLLASSGSTVNEFRYSGERLIPETGLTYLRARYLNNGTGRFWTRDTFPGRTDEVLSLHRYLYAGQNPINNTDPSGHDYTLTTTVAGSGLAITVGSLPTLVISHAFVKAVATAGVLALTLSGDRPNTDFVYRRLSVTEAGTAYRTVGIFGSNLAALDVSPTRHIAEKPLTGSPWISASKNFLIPLRKYNANPTPIIKIDLKKLQTVYLDFTNPALLATLTSDVARENAAVDSEVLIFGFVPARAIVDETR